MCTQKHSVQHKATCLLLPFQYHPPSSHSTLRTTSPFTPPFSSSSLIALPLHYPIQLPPLSSWYWLSTSQRKHHLPLSNQNTIKIIHACTLCAQQFHTRKYTPLSLFSLHFSTPLANHTLTRIVNSITKSHQLWLIPALDDHISIMLKEQHWRWSVRTLEVHIS